MSSRPQTSSLVSPNLRPYRMHHVPLIPHRPNHIPTASELQSGTQTACCGCAQYSHTPNNYENRKERPRRRFLAVPTPARAHAVVSYIHAVHVHMYIQSVRAHGAGGRATSDQPGTCAVMPDVHELRLNWGCFTSAPTWTTVPLPFVKDMETTLD